MPTDDDGGRCFNEALSRAQVDLMYTNKSKEFCLVLSPNENGDFGKD